MPTQRRMMEKRPQTEKMMRVARLWTMAPRKRRRQKREKSPSSPMVTGHRSRSTFSILKHGTHVNTGPCPATDRYLVGTFLIFIGSLGSLVTSSSSDILNLIMSMAFSPSDTL